MSFQVESASSTDYGDDALTGCKLSGMNQLKDVDADDSVDEPAFCEKNTFDNSSDEFHKTDLFGQKRDKTFYKQSKLKVKIKTLTIDGQLVYFCKICDKIFTRRKDKLNHELAHSGESVLTCTECGKEYLHESSLASHMRTHAGDPLYMCDLCPKMFAQSHHLKTHILSHSEPTNFVCKTCYIEFPTSADLNHHIRIQSKHEMSKYWCKMCKVYFCRNHKLTCDKRLHAFCCSACNELFYTQKKLKIHVKKFAHYSLDKPKYIEPLQQHELYPDKIQDSVKKVQAQNENDLVRKPHKSDLIGKTHIDEDTEVSHKKFKLSVRKLILDGDHSSTSVQDSAPEEFQMEIKSPTKQRKGKPYCKKCNKSFKDLAGLNQHKALIHEDKQDQYTCEICNLEFTSKENLDRHGFTHSGEHSHVCPVCGQEFLNSVQLTKHLRVHVADFPYKCSHCGKAFQLKIQLIQHVRLHITQDANTSEKHPQSFTVSNEHQDLCNGEAETFKCHLCSKKFFFRYKLMNHLRLHTNVKCFQCYVCHKTFATKCYLQRHLQVHVKQGMDVNVHNIIIDDHSKFELDSVGEKFTRDNLQNRERNLNRHSLSSSEREKKLDVPCMKNYISIVDLAGKVEDHCSTSKGYQECEYQNDSTVNGVIKLEACDDMDSVSEHSYCSSFTRDSERSDPFKFSSDESYTFKTTMAKERRRLKRRWRKNRGMYIKSDLEALTHLKRGDLNSEAMCSETGSGHEDEVTNMMLELNTVKSEQDDVTTVYVNLTHKKSPSIIKTDMSSSCITGIETSASNSFSLTKCELHIKEVTEVEQEISKVAESSQNDVISTSYVNEAASCGNRLMFEFHVEQLVDTGNHFGNKTADTHSKFNDASNETELQKGESENQMDSNKKIELAQNMSVSSLNLPESGHKSPLKLITPDASVISELSNLEKLQAVFEHSSKYLPLTQTYSTRSCPSHDKTETHIKLTSNTKENEVESNKQCIAVESTKQYHSHDMDTCDTFSLQDNQSSQKSDDKQMAKTVQNIGIDSRKQQEKIRESGSKIPQIASSGLDPSLSNVTVSERLSKSTCSTSETAGSKKNVNNVLPQKAYISSVTDNSIDVGNPVMTSSQIILNTNNCHFSNALLPLTLSTVNDTLQSSSLIFPPPTSLNNNLSYYPMIGNSETEFSQLQSGLNLHTSSVLNMSLNPYFNPVGIQDLSTDNISGNSSCSTNQINTTGPFGSCFISANPLVTPGGVVGLNASSNQNLHLAVNEDCFSLNPSTIFDANNPVYRDMNMMDLISTPSTGCTQGMVATNMDMLRQGNIEMQMRHGITSHVETQNGSFQLHNPFMNFGNPAVSTSLGNFGNSAVSTSFSNFGNTVMSTSLGTFGNPTVSTSLCTFGNSSVNTNIGNFGNLTLNTNLGSFGNQNLNTNLGNFGNPLSFSNQGLVPVNYGNLNNPVLHVRPGGFGSGDDSLMNISNIYGSVYRDDVTLGSYGIPQLSIPIGNLSGSVPINVSGVFPLNSSNLGSQSSFRAGHFNAPVSVNFADFGGSTLTNTGLSSLNQTSFNSELPISIPANSHVISNFMSGMGAFPTSGLQDNFNNFIASSGINLFNSTTIPQNNGTLPGSLPGFINNVNTGYFPKF